jgi:hypothetical protein
MAREFPSPLGDWYESATIKAAVMCFTGTEREEERNGESENRRNGETEQLRFTGSRFTTGVLKAVIVSGHKPRMGV